MYANKISEVPRSEAIAQAKSFITQIDQQRKEGSSYDWPHSEVKIYMNESVYCALLKVLNVGIGELSK